jgi:hypothetical protein
MILSAGTGMKVAWALSIAISVLWAATVSAQPPILITFAADEIESFPAGWTTKESDSASRVYTVRAEGEKRFLHADARGVAVQIGCERKWALKEYPRLRWQWRALQFPEATNERQKAGNDSVLGLYVLFGQWPFAKIIKYIWSDTLPVGSRFDSPFSTSTKVIVVRNGRTPLARWVDETRDVLSDYRQAFGNSGEPPTARGIAILTDADNTNSRAIGDYGDIAILPSVGGKP